MLRWIARRFGRDRRWISDPVEREKHDAKVRARLANDTQTDAAPPAAQPEPHTPPRDAT
jgi:hypothetical protein